VCRDRVRSTQRFRKAANPFVNKTAMNRLNPNAKVQKGQVKLGVKKAVKKN